MYLINSKSFSIYKENIIELYNELQITSIQNIDDFLQLRTITQESYDLLFNQLQLELKLQVERKKVTESITSALSDLNYLIIEDSSILKI